MIKHGSPKNSNILLNKVDLLKKKVNELEEFHFSSKLRRLLKNLIEFIINTFYPKYMEYKESNKKIYFIKAPRFPYIFNKVTDQDIISSLNRILELLFLIAKEKEFAVHFVVSKAKKNSHYKRIFKVFNKPDEFFSFFKNF